MTFEILSVKFVETEVSDTARIEMREVLFNNSMWLILEGFKNGYVFIETGVDRLHVLLHEKLVDRIN